MRSLKKRGSFLLVVLFMVTMMLTMNVLPVVAGGGDEVTLGEFECIVWDDGVHIWNYIGTDTVLNIPAELEGEKVLGLGVDFAMPSSITKLIIEEGVEDVIVLDGDLSNLEEIIIPDTVTNLIFTESIGNSPFYQNEKNWKDGFLYAGNWILDVKGNSVETLVIPEGTIGIKENAVWDNVEKIVVPGSMEVVSSRNFGFAPELKELEFKEGVKGIDLYYEESEVPNLEGLWFPDSISNIELQVYADNYPEEDGVAHFFYSVKPTVYCSEENTVAIEYANKYELPIQYVVNEIVSENGENISVSNENKFITGTKFTAEVLTSGDIYDNAKIVLASVLEKDEKFVVMEMNLVGADGEEMHQLENDVTVTLDVPAELKEADNIRVFRIEDEKYVECHCGVQDEKISFITDHFSTYVFVEEQKECIEHIYGEWTVVKEATTTAKGSKVRICTICGCEDVSEIPIIEVTVEEEVADTIQKEEIDDKKDVIDKENSDDKVTADKEEGTDKDINTDKEEGENRAPKTGDVNSFGLWSTILVIAFACIMYSASRSRVR